VHPAAQLALDPAAQDDLELVLTGALAPWTGAGRPGDGITVTLPAGGDEIAAGDEVRLLDLEGAPLAELTVTGSYPASEGVGLIGPVRVLADRETRPFERYYLSPVAVAERRDAAVVVPLEQAPTLSDVEQIAERAAGRRVLLLALVGAGRPRGVSAAGLIRACLAAASSLSEADVVAVPLARHADPALDASLRDRVVAAYTPQGAPDGSAVLRLDHDGPLPEAVAEAVRLDRSAGIGRGVVVLFTGLSGSGKSTIARGLRNALIEDGRRTVTMLDGDVVRRHLSAGLGFSRADRDTNIRRIGWVAAEISRHGGVAIASPIAPFAATRAAVRAMVDDAGGEFVLVHVATPLAECERRDRKGLYARARAGEIEDFTGISSPYEEPTDADLRIDTTGRSVDEAVRAVLTELRRRELIA
jgi:sulfate adenylyltransferase